MPSGITLIDNLFKERFLPNSSITIIYDAFSLAWAISFAILANKLKEGAFGVILNYNMPIKKLFRLAEFVGLNLKEEVKKGNVAIIDVFGSRYGSRFDMKNIFYLDIVDPETINPKIELIYSELRPYFTNREIIRLVYTLDGVSLMFGENATLKLLNQTIASREKDAPNSILILPLNRDIVSQRFVAWVTSISDYIIIGSSKIEEEGLSERLHFIKSPVEDFEPCTYRFWTTKGRSVERLKVKKLNL